MGVKKFITTFIASLPATFDTMRETCVAVAIDMNQFIHQALNKLIEATCGGNEVIDGIETQFLRENIKTSDELLAVYSSSCATIIDAVIAELMMIKNLKELYITMDGTPCYGKIQNQIDRRRKPKRIVKKNSDGSVALFLSSALILPGTPLMETFTTVLRTKLQEFSKTRPNVSLTMSLSDIPGEGEHKALDYLNASPHTSFSRSNGGSGAVSPYLGCGTHVASSFMIWSNDSDVVISLIHRPAVNVFIMTDNVTGAGMSVLNCINLANVRERLCNDYREVLNAPLLLAFAGNDYLPEMLDTIDLGASYSRLKTICGGTSGEVARAYDSKRAPGVLCLTKEDKPAGVTDLLLNVRQNDEVVPTEEVEPEVIIANDEPVSFIQKEASLAFSSIPKKPMYGYSRIIDFAALRTLFRAMAEEEIVLYYTEIVPRYRMAPKRLLLFRDDVNDMLADRVAFKRKYYKMVYEELYKIGVITYTNSGANPTDSELYALEMKMATDYMKTYCWYYYYQSGMFIGQSEGSPLNNSFYSYVFPPLYSSLFILLDRAEPEYLIQFDLAFNPLLRPQQRELDYFQKLPTFTALHWYIVLQKEDGSLLQYFSPQHGREKNPVVPFNDPDFDVEKKYVEKSTHIVDRYGKPIEISKRAPIERFVETYRNFVGQTTAQLIKLGREEESNQTAQGSQRGKCSERYLLRGKASFG